MGLLEGKVALITGAARGIGKAIALKFASEGADIAFTDLVINEAAEETVKEIEAFGHKVKAYASNAAMFEETGTVVEEILAEFGKIDILVNNAGITKDGLVMRMTEQQWDAVINVIGIQLHPRRYSVNGSPEERKHHQYGLYRRSDGQSGAGELCFFEGRPHRDGKVCRKGNGVARYSS